MLAIYNGPECLADRVKVAVQERQRRTGLLGRTSFEPGEALWIIPCDQIHTMGLLWSIDVIFLSKDSVVRMVATVPPGTASVSCPGAHSCIELPPGVAAAIAVGTQLTIQPLA